MNPPRPVPLPTSEPASKPSAAPRISSDALLRGRSELVIDHNGQEYRLRLTRNDKLILNK